MTRLGRFAFTNAQAQESVPVIGVYLGRIGILWKADHPPERSGEALLCIDTDALIIFWNSVLALPCKHQQALVDRELNRLGVNARGKCDDFYSVGRIAD